MVKLYDGGVYLVNGADIVPEAESEKVRALTGRAADRAAAAKGTIHKNAASRKVSRLTKRFNKANNA